MSFLRISGVFFELEKRDVVEVYSLRTSQRQAGFVLHPVGRFDMMGDLGRVAFEIRIGDYRLNDHHYR
jgi:hypothetical protein